VQVVAITDATDTDEVQTVRVTTSSGAPEGRLYLSFNTTVGCTLCAIRSYDITNPIEVGIGPNNISITGTAATKAALAALNMEW